MGSCMDHRLLMPRRMGGFSPLSYGSDLALWLDPSYGIYTDRSTQLAAASSQYWSVASNATIQAGDVDLWWAGWVNLDSRRAVMHLFGKGSASMAAQIEHGVYFETSNNRFNFYIGNGSSFGTVAANTLGLPATGAWYFIFSYHDSVNNTVNISVNGGAFDSAAYSGGCNASGSGALRVGEDSLASGYYHDGKADSVMFGKSPVGGIAALATTIRDSLFNSNAGKVSADLTAAEKTAWGLVSAYDFDGDGLDAHGSNDLTAVNSPTYTSGIASGTAGDGDLVSLIVPRVGPNLVPPSYAGRPTWYANGGKPYISFDGVNDGLQTASNISLGAFTIAGNFYASGSAGMLYEHGAGAEADSCMLYGTLANSVNVMRGGVQAGRDLSSNWAVDSTWRTIATTYDGTVAGFLMRFNGVNQSLTTTVSNNPGTGVATKALYLANRNGAGLYSAARIGDVVATQHSLSAAQLAQLEPWLIARRPV